MKKLFCFISCALLALGICGCATFKSVTQPKAPAAASAESAPLPAYSGPKAKIAVADFDVKVALATPEDAADLRKMLVAALVKSERFSVVERKEEANPADLIISVAVTEFEPEVSGGRAGVGGGSSPNSGVLGSLLGGPVNKAHMALDIRIVNAATSEVLAAMRVQGQASDTAGAVRTASSEKQNLGPGLSDYANTPMERAIDSCIVAALRYIAQTIPQHYYRY